MILGIGVDSVEVARFANWYTYSRKKLSKIFSDQEIDYCLSLPIKSAERFAVRFAAREALYKAYNSWRPDHQIPFLTFCKAVTISKKVSGVPEALLNIIIVPDQCKILISLAHSHTTATAFAILEQIDCK
jgi:phosphopantetheine--protein transferase-like protein